MCIAPAEQMSPTLKIWIFRKSSCNAEALGGWRNQPGPLRQWDLCLFWVLSENWPCFSDSIGKNPERD
jgi:hypothetical protein